MRRNAQSNAGFDLALPCELLRIGRKRVEARCETTSVSATDAVVKSFALRVTVGDPIEFRIELPVSESNKRVAIRCLGNVEHINETTTMLSIKRYRFERMERADS